MTEIRHFKLYTISDVDLETMVLVCTLKAPGGFGLEKSGLP